MIILDASYLVVYLHPSPKPAKDRNDKPVSQFQERVNHLIATLNASENVIGLPAPAVAEVLVRSGRGRAKYLSVLSNTRRFEILPFDARAAIEAGELIAKIKTNSQPWETWAKLKFDAQIVSIAKAEDVSTIYADDKDIENYAKRFNIPVVRICDLPLPPQPELEAPQQQSLIGNDGQMQLSIVVDESTEKSAPEAVSGDVNQQKDKDDKREASATHPLEVRGSSESGAGNETGKEASKEEAQKPPKGTRTIVLEDTPETPKPASEGGLGKDGS